MGQTTNLNWLAGFLPSTVFSSFDFFSRFFGTKRETLGDKKPPNSIAKVDVPSKRFVLVVLMNSFGHVLLNLFSKIGRRLTLTNICSFGMKLLRAWSKNFQKRDLSLCNFQILLTLKFGDFTNLEVTGSP